MTYTMKSTNSEAYGPPNPNVYGPPAPNPVGPTGYDVSKDVEKSGGGIFGGLASLLGFGGGGEEDAAEQEHQKNLQSLAQMFMGGMGSSNPMTSQLMQMFNPMYGGMSNGMSPYLLPASAIGGGLGSMVKGWMKNRNSAPAAQATTGA